ncbi:MAG: PEP-CTERM sorting domain-containing protein [Planctomycetota bacterium]|nr:MAG: PEP-CTERM sorting domain-containing protein [Planctomycetota bacterium]
MKKLLVLMLVLGITSWASAAYDINVTPLGGGDFDIDVTSDGLDDDGYWALYGDPGALLSGIAIGPDAPSLTQIWGDVSDLSGYLPEPTGTPSAGKYGPVAAAQGETKLAGTYWTASASVPVEGWVYLYSFTEAGVYTQEAAKYIPEPMTIALLGLGGLFLRRRR